MLPAVASSPLGIPVEPEVNLTVVQSVAPHTAGSNSATVGRAFCESPVTVAIGTAWGGASSGSGTSV